MSDSPRARSHRAESEPNANPGAKDVGVQADSRPEDDVYHHRMTTHRVLTMLELFDNAEDIDWYLVASGFHTSPDSVREVVNKAREEQRKKDEAKAAGVEKTANAPDATAKQRIFHKYLNELCNSLTRPPTMAVLRAHLMTKPEFQKKKPHTVDCFARGYLDAHGWSLVKTTERSSVRPDCADDIKKFLQSVKAIRRLDDKPFGALACYDEIPLPLARGGRGKMILPPGIPQEYKKRVHDEAGMFGDARASAVVCVVMKPKPKEGDPAKYDVTVLKPFLIFAGATKPAVRTKLDYIRDHPGMALTPSTFTTSDTMGKMLAWFRGQIETDGHIWWCYDNYKPHAVNERWVQDKEKEHVLPGPPACTWLWQVVDVGLGKEVGDLYNTYTEAELSRWDPKTPVAGNDGPLHPFQVHHRLCQVCSEINQLRTPLKYFWRAGYCEPHVGPRVNSRNGHRYVGWEFALSVPALDEVPSKPLIPPSEWGAGTAAGFNFPHILDTPHEHVNEVARYFEDDELPGGPAIPEDSENLARPLVVVSDEFAKEIRSVCEPMGPQVITLLERNGIVNPAVFRHAVTVDSKRQVFIQQQRVGQTNPAFENMLLTLHDRLAVAAAAPAVKAHHK